MAIIGKNVLREDIIVRPRYSLTTLLLFISLCGIASGVIAYVRNQRMKMRNWIIKMEAAGSTFEFAPSAPVENDWYEAILGDNSYERIETVWVAPEISDSDLPFLRNLSRIKAVNASGAVISRKGIAVLEAAKQLNWEAADFGMRFAPAMTDSCFFCKENCHGGCLHAGEVLRVG